MRGDAELGLADAVTRANEAMQRITQINRQLATSSAGDATTANLLDQRDVYIDQLAQMMDINVVPGDFNQLSVFTNSGVQLVGINARRWSSTRRAHEPVRAVEQRSGAAHGRHHCPEGPERQRRRPPGQQCDPIGRDRRLLEMRDEVLVQAQTQLDEIAAAMARALSDRTIDGTAVAPVPQAGFDIDLSNLIDGNSVRVTYTDNRRASSARSR